jgi:hypothetical protein
MTNVRNLPNLGLSSIDSFKLRIELSQLKTYDKTLNDTLYVSTEDGTIEKEFKRKSKQYYLDGYSFYASISEGVRVSQNRFADCLTVLINSKQLEHKYFEGVSNSNVKDIFDKIIDIGIFDCSYKTFLDAHPTDIDFKKDYKLPLEDYLELIKVCGIMTPLSNSNDKGKRIHNKGISWSNRETSKYLTNPFTKIYHKETELRENSTDFTSLYLNSIDFKNVFRIETTVKNRTHLKRLKLNLNTFTLRELLSLSNTQKDSIIANAINSHLSPRNKSLTFKTQSKMTPTKRQQLNALLVLTTDLNYSLDRSINLLLNGIENKVSKSLNKKTLNQLYNDEIKGTDYEAKTSKIESIFDNLGWN